MSKEPESESEKVEAVADAAWDSILFDAFTLVHGDRGNRHGAPWEDYFNTVTVFNNMTGHDLNKEEGVLFVLLSRITRIAYGIETELAPELLKDLITEAAADLDQLWAALINPDPVVEIDEEDEEEYEEEEDD
jgi:hypothetical protein